MPAELLSASARVGMACAESHGDAPAPDLTAASADAFHVATSSESFDLGEVCRAADVARVRALCERALAEGRAVICRNLGHIAVARAAGVAWEAAAPLNVWNTETARWLHGLGARRIWLPEELSEGDVRALRAAAMARGDAVACAGVVQSVDVSVAHAASDVDMRSADAILGVRVRSVRAALGTHVRSTVSGSDLVGALAMPEPGSTPLMITEHCLLTAEGPCAHLCRDCPRRLASLRGERVLVELDRKSSHARLRVEVDEWGRTRLYKPPADDSGAVTP